MVDEMHLRDKKNIISLSSVTLRAKTKETTRTAVSQLTNTLEFDEKWTMSITEKHKCKHSVKLHRRDPS